jgi:glycerol-3-phosphate acyltransferase PlsY
MAGHSWPVYLKFKGGKIIATGAGVVLALSPLATLIALLVWLSVLGIFRYVSLSSICAAVSVPVSLYALGNGWKYVSFGTLLALLAVYKHIPNIKRLIAGNELKVGTKKK